MLRKFISALIILSIIVSDNAWCLKPNKSIDEEDFKDESSMSSTVKRISKSLSENIPILGNRRSKNIRNDYTDGAFSLKDMSTLLQEALSREDGKLRNYGTNVNPDDIQEWYDDNSEASLERDDSSVEIDEDVSAPGSSLQEECSLVPNLSQHLDSMANSIKAVDSASNIIHPQNLSMLLEGADLENLPNLPPVLQSLLLSVQELENGYPTQQKTVRFLAHVYDHIIQGKLTQKQLFSGGIGGLVIATGVGAATTWLFHDSVDNLLSLNGLSFGDISGLLYFDFTFNYAQWVIFTDVLCRNMQTLSQFTAPSFSEFNENHGLIHKSLLKIIDVLIYGASCPAGLLLCYALYGTNFGGSIYENLFYFSPLALSLFLDDVLFFGSRLSPLIKNFLRGFLINKNNSEKLQAEQTRTEFIQKFKELKKLFLALPNNSIGETWKKILNPNIFSNVNANRLPNDLKSAESLYILQVLHHYHALHKEHPPHHKKKKLLNYLRKIPEWGLPLISTPGRSVIFYYVIDEILKIVGLENEPVKMVLSILLGGGVASFVQLKFEAKGIEHLLHKFIEDKEEHYCTPSVKRRLISLGATLHDYFAGLWLVIPYMTLGIYATEGWDLSIRLACLIPCGLTAFLGNAMILEESKEDIVNFLKFLDLTSHPNKASQQRRQLIVLVEHLKKIFATLHSDILLLLEPKLNLEALSKEQVHDESSNKNTAQTPQGLASILNLQSSESQQDQKTLHFLAYAQEVLIQNKKTLTQTTLSGMMGALLALMGGINIYSNLYLAFEQIIPLKVGNIIWNSTNGIQIDYFVPFLALDAFARTIQVVSAFLAPSTIEFDIPTGLLKRTLRITTKILAYGGAVFASVLSTYYYLAYDLFFEKAYGSSTLYDFGSVAPFIFCNSLTFYGPHLSKFVDRVVNRFASLCHGIPSFAEKKREAFLKEFKDLKRWFASLKDEDVNEVYDQVLFHDLLEPTEESEQRDQYLAARTLKTLWVLHQYHANNLMSEPEPETVRKAFSKTVGWGLPLAAAFGNAVIYWYIFYNLFQIMGLQDEATNMTLSIIFGGIIGSLGHGAVEVEATEKAVYELTGGKKIGQDTGQGFRRKATRIVGKAQNYIAGVLMSLPLIAIGMAGTADWSLWLRLCALIPAGVAETLKNTLMFNESIGGAAQFIDNKVAAKLAYPTATQKRNQLVAMMRRYRKMFKTLHPDILMKLDGMLESVNGKEEEFDDSNTDFVSNEAEKNGGEEKLNVVQDD